MEDIRDILSDKKEGDALLSIKWAFGVQLNSNPSSADKVLEPLAFRASPKNGLWKKSGLWNQSDLNFNPHSDACERKV